MRILLEPIVIALLVGTFFIGMSIGSAEGSPGLLLSSYLPAAITLLAAYIGARFAFDFQNKQEATKEKKSEITASNLAIFKLSKMANDLGQYKKQIVDPAREDPMRYVSMPPTLNKLTDCPMIDLDSLNFLFEIDPSLVGDLSAVQSHFQVVGDLIQDRTQLHRYPVQDALHAAGIIEGVEYPVELIEKALGAKLFGTMVQATDDIITHVDDNLVRLIEMGETLSTVLKKKFPDAVIIRFSLPV